MAQRPLIGTSPNQVSTNGMLGDLAFQDSNGAYIETIRGAVNLDKLDKEITDTAVDIFVYDTRKDSDCGAWRKRTQHTSWYNETLNTATRGSRREFPAVAVLVLTAHKLTIYDGDNPDLPMWMDVYQYVNGGSGGTTTNWHGGSGTFTSVAALNGIIICCTNGTRNLHFVNDRMSLFYSPTSGNYTQRGGISNRNDSYTSWGPSDEYYAQLVNATSNDVAMTVLPNAPIDDATGLPIPTIAVATNGGVSVIKDNRNVVDFFITSPYNDATGIQFLDDNSLILTGQNSGAQSNDHWVQIFNIPSSDESASGWSNNVSALREYASPIGGTLINNIALTPTDYSNSGSEIVDFYKNKAFGYNDKLTLLYDVAESPTSSSVAYATTSYNTGWMQGDIKGAFLSDTTVESFSPSNLVTEDFSANWTGSTGGVLSVSSGQLTITNTGANGRAVSNQFATTSGKKYAFIAKGVSSTSGGTYRLEVRGPELVATSLTAGTLVIYFNGTGNSTTYVELYAIGGSGVSVTYEDAYVVELEEDRSVNNKGLQVFGTVTKSAVATGAELVAYGPFSTSNRLQQPYNSDFNFGTNDFSVMFWFKSTASGTEQFVRKGNPSDDVGCFESYITSVGGSGNIRFVIKHTDGSSASVLNAGTAGWNNGIWHHYVGVRRSSDSMELYLNGVLSNSTTTPYSVTNTSSSSILDIGSVGSLVNGASNSYLSLIRISGSAPSAEQIKKIYEDEKVLFQENAACTLYGSSDAVTALAYDDSTNLLYAGTSSGRSDFQGLRRINNTTTAVTTAISASNGLVAEQ